MSRRSHARATESTSRGAVRRLARRNAVREVASEARLARKLFDARAMPGERFDAFLCERGAFCGVVTAREREIPPHWAALYQRHAVRSYAAAVSRTLRLAALVTGR